MTPKERVLATLSRKPVDRLPVDLWHTPEIAAMLRRHCGTADDLSMWQALGLDKIAWVFMEYQTGVGQRVGTQLGTGVESSEARTLWGAQLREIQAGPALYAEVARAPMADLQDSKEVGNYPLWPRVEGFDYAGAVAKAKSASEHFAVIGPWVSHFEIYCQLRGLEQSLADLIENPELVDTILDRVEFIQTEMMKRFFKEAAGFLDLVFVSDDIAGQQSLLMSPQMWERHLQPRLKRWCELIHANGLKVFYHTDGAARRLLRPILDCGVDVLNPIQHACPGMDLRELKREFGSQVIFHGGVDNQRILSRGTPDMVRAEVVECFKTLGEGREGFICCSCHNVQPGTPLENILAMIETARAAGCHGLG